MAQDLDVITIGRSSVDLYGQQIGGRLEDMGSFAKSVGGCPSNIAIGAARLGLKSAVLTRVGDEHMGRYIREQMAREGVAIDGIITDPKRLTALVILGVRDSDSFPLIFYRSDCADMALDQSEVDPAFFRRARAIVVTGTHFSTPTTAAAQRKAMKIARETGAKIVFDIDYRPNLWGLAGHGAGESRYIASDRVSQHLQPILPDCDLIVGTEEEVKVAGGAEDVLTALRNIRVRSGATIVLKRGPKGCTVFPDAIPDTVDQGIVGSGFPIEVYNVLGAGDAFMSGFLRGWLTGEPLETCATWANACGAFAVSRLLCSPEIPTWTELQYFLRYGSKHHALRHDADLNHIHWSTTRRDHWPTLMAFAIDHRAQLEELADKAGASRTRIGEFKVLAVAAATKVADGQPGFGMLLDGTYGREALFRAAEEAGRVPAVDADLRDFMESLASDRAALGSLLNPRLPHEAKQRIVAALLKDADPLVRNAMLVLVDNGRLELLHDVSVAYAELAAEQERILDIEVTTAVELDPAQVQQLQQSIEQATGLSARLEAKIDPAIIGGIVLRARGVLLDASVQRELEEIHRALITTPLPVGSEA